MNNNLTSNLYDDISDLSEEDSFMCYKNVQRLPNGHMPVFKKPKQKLFPRNPSNIKRVRKSEILRCLDTPKKNTLVCSTPMNPLIASRASNKQLPLSPISLSENILSHKSQDLKTLQKKPLNTPVKSMIAHLSNLAQNSKYTSNSTINKNDIIKLTTETTEKNINVQSDEIDKNCSTNASSNVQETLFKSTRNTQFRRLMLERQTQTTDSLQRISDHILESNKDEIVKENINKPVQPSDQAPLDIVQTSSNQCLTNHSNNDVVINQFLKNFDSSIAHENPSIISISSESSVSNTITNMSLAKNDNKKSFSNVNGKGEDNSDVFNKQISYQCKETEMNEIEINTKQASKESDKNENKLRKTTLNSSKDKKDADRSSEITDLNVATLNPQNILIDSLDDLDNIEQNEIENVNQTNVKLEQKRNTKKTSTTKHIKEENIKKSKSSDVTFVTKQTSRSKSTSNEKSTNRKSTKRASSIRKTINLQQYLVCRKSGFVEVCENDTSSGTDDSFIGERSRRKRKPPKAFIQATLFSAASLRKKTAKEKRSNSIENKPNKNTKCTAVSQNKSNKEIVQTSNNHDENAFTISSMQVTDSTEKNIIVSEVSSDHIFKKPRSKSRITKNDTQILESIVEVEDKSMEQGSSINNCESVDSRFSIISKDADCHIHDLAILPEIQELHTSDPSVENKETTDNGGSKQIIEILDENDIQTNNVPNINVTHSEVLPVQNTEVETIATTTIINSEEHSKSLTRSSNRCIIINNVYSKQTDFDNDAHSNVRKPTRKSVTFVDYPEECLEHNQKSIVLYNENENTKQNVVANVNIFNKNVIHTVIDNKVVPLEWCSKAPPLNLTTDKELNVDYCLKNLKTHFGTASYGFLTFGPGVSKTQTSMHYSLTYKVEKGRAAICIQVQEQVMDVNCCFHIPLGSTYSIRNLSKNEPLVLFFHKNSVT